MDRNVQQIGNLNLDGILRIKEQTNVPALDPGFGVIYVKADDGTGNQGLAFRYANDSGTVEMNIGGDSAQDNINNGGTTSGGKSGAYVPVRVATLGAINLLNAPTIIDGITLADGDRVLVKDQAIASENGIYTVSLSTSVFLVRATDMNEDTEFFVGATTLVKEGVIYRGSSFTLISGETLAQDKVFQTAPRGSYYQCRVSSQGNVDLGTPPTVVDGLTLVEGDRVLVRSQDTSTENGIYVVGSTSWTRAGDLDGEEDLFLGSTVVAGTTLYIHTSGSLATGMVFTKVNNGTYNAVRVVTVGNVDLVTPPTVVNGITLVQGDRVLVRLQTTASENGIYVVGASTWTRASDMSTDDDLVVGSSVWSTEGDVYSYKVFHHASGNTIAGPKEFVTAVVEYAPVVAASASGENVGLVAVSTVDGVSVNEGDRVLLKDQTNLVENGIYVATGGVYVRAGDMAVDQQLVAGTSVFVTGGSTNADKLYIFKSGTIATDKTFVELSGGGGGGFVPEDSLPEEAAVYDIDSQSGLQFWFKANFGVDGPAYSGRNFVTKWYDQSDSGLEFSAPRNNIAPKFVTRDDNYDAVRFDHTTRNNQGSQMSVNTSAFARPNTLFVVFSIKSAVAEGYLLSSSDSVTNHTIKVNAGGLVLDVEGVTMPAVVADQLNVMTIVFNDAPTETKIYLNNMTIPSGDQATVTGSLNGMTLGVNPVTGNSDGISADVAEIMFYNVGMGFENRAEVMCYLATKHGIMLQDGLLAWYKSNAGITTSGGRVTEWANQVCNTNIGNLTVDAGATQGPLLVVGNPDANNQDTLSFAGATDGLSVDFGVADDAVPNTILIVFNTATTDASSDGRLMSSNDSATNHNIDIDTVGKEFTIGGQVGSTIPDYEMPNEMTDYHLLNIHFASGTDAFAYLDSFLIKHFEGVSTATMPLTGLSLGAGSGITGFSGNICEIMVYSDATATFNSTLGLISITKYLVQKYGVTLDPISLALDAKYEAGLLDPTQVVMSDPEALNVGITSTMYEGHGLLSSPANDRVIQMRDNHILYCTGLIYRHGANTSSRSPYYTNIVLCKYDDNGVLLKQSNSIKISFHKSSNLVLKLSKINDSTCSVAVYLGAESGQPSANFGNYSVFINYDTFAISHTDVLKDQFLRVFSTIGNNLVSYSWDGTFYIHNTHYAKTRLDIIESLRQNILSQAASAGASYTKSFNYSLYDGFNNKEYIHKMFPIDDNHVLCFFTGESSGFAIDVVVFHTSNNSINAGTPVNVVPSISGGTRASIEEIVPGSKWIYYYASSSSYIITLNDISPSTPNFEPVLTPFTGNITGGMMVKMFDETEGVLIGVKSNEIVARGLYINGTTVTQNATAETIVTYSSSATNESVHNAVKLNNNTILIIAKVNDANATESIQQIKPSNVYAIHRQRRISQWSDQEVNADISGDTNDHLLAGGTAFEPYLYRSEAIRLDSSTKRLERVLGAEEIERVFSTVFVMKVNEAPTGNAILLGNTAVIEIADSTKSLQVNGVELYDNSEYQVNTVVWDSGATYVYQNSVVNGIDVGDTGSDNLGAISLGGGNSANVDIKEFQIYQGNVIEDANVVVNLATKYGIELELFKTFDLTSSELILDYDNLPDSSSNPTKTNFEFGAENYNFIPGNRSDYIMLNDTEFCYLANNNTSNTTYCWFGNVVADTITGIGYNYVGYNFSGSQNEYPYVVKINDCEVLTLFNHVDGGVYTPIILKFMITRNGDGGVQSGFDTHPVQYHVPLEYSEDSAIHTHGLLHLSNHLVLVSYQMRIVDTSADNFRHMIALVDCSSPYTCEVLDTRTCNSSASGSGAFSRYNKNMIKLTDRSALVLNVNASAEAFEYTVVHITDDNKIVVTENLIGDTFFYSINTPLVYEHKMIRVRDYVCHFNNHSTTTSVRMILMKIHGDSLELISNHIISNTTKSGAFDVDVINGLIVYTEYNSSNQQTVLMIRINADDTVDISSFLTPFGTQSVGGSVYAPRITVIDDTRAFVYSEDATGTFRVMNFDWNVLSWGSLVQTGSAPSLLNNALVFESNEQVRETLTNAISPPFTIVFAGKLNSTDAADTCILDTGNNKISVTADTQQLKIDAAACEDLNGNVVVCVSANVATTSVYVNSTDIFTTVPTMGNMTDICVGRSIDSSQLAANFSMYDIKIYKDVLTPDQVATELFTKHSITNNMLYSFSGTDVVTNTIDITHSQTETLYFDPGVTATGSFHIKYGKLVTTYGVSSPSNSLNAVVSDIDSDNAITNSTTTQLTSGGNVETIHYPFWLDATNYVIFYNDSTSNPTTSAGTGSIKILLCSIDGSNTTTINKTFFHTIFQYESSNTIFRNMHTNVPIQVKNNEFIVFLLTHEAPNTNYDSNHVSRLCKIIVDVDNNNIFVKGVTKGLTAPFEARSEPDHLYPYDFRNNRVLVAGCRNHHASNTASSPNNHVYYHEVDEYLNITKTCVVDLGVMYRANTGYFEVVGLLFLSNTRFIVKVMLRNYPRIQTKNAILIYDVVNGEPVLYKTIGGNNNMGTYERSDVHIINENKFILLNSPQLVAYHLTDTGYNKNSITSLFHSTMRSHMQNDVSGSTFVSLTTTGTQFKLVFTEIKTPVNTLDVLTSANVTVAPDVKNDTMLFRDDISLLEANIDPLTLETPYTVFLVGAAKGTSSNLTVINDFEIDATTLTIGSGTFEVGTDTRVVAAVIDPAGTGRVYNNSVLSTNITGGTASTQDLQIGPANYDIKTVQYYKGNMADADVVSKIFELANKYDVQMSLESYYDINNVLTTNTVDVITQDLTGITHNFTIIATRHLTNTRKALLYLNLVDTEYYVRVVEEGKADLVSNLNTLTGLTISKICEGGFKKFNGSEIAFTYIDSNDDMNVDKIIVGVGLTLSGNVNTLATGSTLLVPSLSVKDSTITIVSVNTVNTNATLYTLYGDLTSRSAGSHNTFEPFSASVDFTDIIMTNSSVYYIVGQIGASHYVFHSSQQSADIFVVNANNASFVDIRDNDCILVGHGTGSFTSIYNLQSHYPNWNEYSYSNNVNSSAYRDHVGFGEQNICIVNYNLSSVFRVILAKEVVSGPIVYSEFFVPITGNDPDGTYKVISIDDKELFEIHYKETTTNTYKILKFSVSSGASTLTDLVGSTDITVDTVAPYARDSEIVFNDLTQSMSGSITISSPFTIATIVKTTGDGNVIVFDNGDTVTSSGGNLSVNGTEIVNDEYKIVVASFVTTGSGVLYDGWVDNTQAITAVGTASITDMVVGNGIFNMKCLYVYNGTLATNEVEYVFKSLSEKYNIYPASKYWLEPVSKNILSTPRFLTHTFSTIRFNSADPVPDAPTGTTTQMQENRAFYYDESTNRLYISYFRSSNNTVYLVEYVVNQDRTNLYRTNIWTMYVGASGVLGMSLTKLTDDMFAVSFYSTSNSFIYASVLDIHKETTGYRATSISALTNNGNWQQTRIIATSSHTFTISATERTNPGGEIYMYNGYLDNSGNSISLASSTYSLALSTGALGTNLIRPMRSFTNNSNSGLTASTVPANFFTLYGQQSTTIGISTFNYRVQFGAFNKIVERRDAFTSSLSHKGVVDAIYTTRNTFLLALVNTSNNIILRIYTNNFVPITVTTIDTNYYTYLNNTTITLNLYQWSDDLFILSAGHQTTNRRFHFYLIRIGADNIPKVLDVLSYNLNSFLSRVCADMASGRHDNVFHCFMHTDSTSTAAVWISLLVKDECRFVKLNDEIYDENSLDNGQTKARIYSSVYLLRPELAIDNAIEFNKRMIGMDTLEYPKQVSIPGGFTIVVKLMGGQYADFGNVFNNYVTVSKKDEIYVNGSNTSYIPTGKFVLYTGIDDTGTTVAYINDTNTTYVVPQWTGGAISTILFGNTARLTSSSNDYTDCPWMKIYDFIHHDTPLSTTAASYLLTRLKTKHGIA